MVYFFDTDESNYEKMKLIDALELLITPNDPNESTESIKYTWDITAYSKDYIWIQLDFINPWEISNDSQFDTLSVTFWGVDYFKSYQNREVKFGTTLYHPIFRQVSASEKETIDQLHSVVDFIFISTMLMVLPVIMAGSLLPTWMFINSLQIIAHMVLLKTLMPGTSHYFLLKLLNWLRWYDEDFIESLEGTSFDFKEYDLDFGAYHALLKAGNYEHLFIQNMVIICALLLFFVLIWLIIVIKDLIIFLLKRSKRDLKPQRMKE